MATIETKRKRWLDRFFIDYKYREQEMDEKIKELTAKGYGISKVYNIVRKLQRWESYPDHQILVKAICESRKVLSDKTIRYHFDRLLGPEYDAQEKREIIQMHFPTSADPTA